MRCVREQVNVKSKDTYLLYPHTVTGAAEPEPFPMCCRVVRRSARIGSEQHDEAEPNEEVHEIDLQVMTTADGY